VARSASYEAQRRLASVRRSLEHAEDAVKKAKREREKIALQVVVNGHLTRTEVAQLLGVSRAWVSRVDSMPPGPNARTTEE
jgi:DNA-directed RNA polymerase specialized sigma subunit